MIVKVQMAFSTPAPRCLIYDKRHRFEFEGPASEDLLLIMNGRPKAFFLAEVTEQKQFSLGREAQWQAW